MKKRISVYRVYGANGSRFRQNYDTKRQAQAAVRDLTSDNSSPFRYGIKRISYCGNDEVSRKVIQFG